MWTSATQWSFFDERDFHPFRPAINGGRNRIAATEHNEIVVFGIHVKEMSRSVTRGQKISGRVGGKSEPSCHHLPATYRGFGLYRLLPFGR
jgi:hypothetical protein